MPPTLRTEKMRALQELIGNDGAQQLLSSLKERDQMADDMGIGFKSAGGPMNEAQEALKDAMLQLFGAAPEAADDEATSEKCTPGTKDGKYTGKAEEEDMGDDMDEEDMGEDEEVDEEDMILSTAEIKAIAGEVAKAMAGSMAELKAMMSTRKKSNDNEAIETLKEYTEAQNEFSERLVDTLEELLTRVKALESAGVGHIPSQSGMNTTGMNALYNMKPEQHVENWLFNNR